MSKLSCGKLTIEEQEVIRLYSKKKNWKSAPELARMLNRETASGISAFRYREKLRCPHEYRCLCTVWTPKMVEILKKYSTPENYVSARELCEILNSKLDDGAILTANSVSSQRTKQKLTLTHIHKKRATLMLTPKSKALKEFICKNCGVKFLDYEYKNRVYCGNKCYYKAANHQKGKKYAERGEVTCETCGKKFSVTVSEMKRKPRKFCSRKCYSKHHKRWKTPKLKIKCKNCNKEFDEPNYQLKRGPREFCSRKCAYEYKVKHQLPKQHERQRRIKLAYYKPIHKLLSELKNNHHDVWLALVHKLTENEYRAIRTFLSKNNVIIYKSD